MFKWRSKNKFKSVFMLQFQATEVPPSKKPGVTVALVPEDVGKPTVKLEKAPILDGTCSWDNPIYETVKLIRDPKTGKIKEKIYHFIVSTGSSKSGFLGEASIDFADFAMETEALTVSLPLKFANSGAVLHVTILRMEGPDDQREMEENEAMTENGTFRASSATLPSTWDIPCEQNLMPHKGAVDDTSLLMRSNTDWSVGSASDGSLVDSSNSLEDNVVRERCHDVSDEKLKGEIAILMNQASVSELELQTLRRQIVKETKRWHTQSSEIVSLRDERDFFKRECEQLKSLQKYNESQVQDLKDLVEEIKKELDHEEDLNSNLKMQLKEMQDSNSKLILELRELNEMLGQKNEEIDCLSQKTETRKSLEEHNCNEEIDSLKQKIADLSGEIEVYRKHKDNLAIYVEQLTVENEILKQENQKTSEIELLTERWNKEREDLDSKFASARMEAERLLEELMNMRSKKDENERLIRNLQSEKQSLRTQYSRLKDRVGGEDIEKENTKKEVLQLKDELQKKESKITRIEMQSAASEASMISLKKNLKLLEEEVKLKEAGMSSQSERKVQHKVSIAHCSDESNITELVSELTLVKERNKSMESDLKEMQERYTEISLKFAEVEGERQQLVMTVRNLKNGKKN